MHDDVKCSSELVRTPALEQQQPPPIGAVAL